MKGCRYEGCKVSNGIHGGLTFGYGELDKYGYWEYPCVICARAWEKKYPEEGPCWPFSEEKHDEAFNYYGLPASTNYSSG